MSYLKQEINAQPDAIARLLDAEDDNIRRVAAAIRDYNPSFVMIAARGTSDNAARYAQYLLGTHAKLAVSLAVPSVHTLYGVQPDMSRALVIGISQSGASEDVRQVVADAKAQGALTLGITNSASSLLAQGADHHIELHAGQEKSVAATKTYTTELTAIALLTQHLTGDAERLARLATLPRDIERTLANTAEIHSWAQRYRFMERLAVIGRGYNYATAFEISLKIKELCYIVGEQYSEADFRHGPIAIVSSGFPVMVVAPSGVTYALLLDLIHTLKERDAELIVISDVAEALDLATTGVRLPEDVPEWLSPVCAVIPGQVFAWQVALSRGYDVDQPRGLNKVTVTR